MLEEVWEDIIKRNSKENNNFAFELYFSTAKSYNLLINEYNLIKACLMKLLIRYDKSVVNLLKDRGYHIDASGRDAYYNSIEAAHRRSNNLLTKIITKQKELERLTDNESKETLSFARALAIVSAGMGFEVSDTVKLATYNEYKKIINKKNGRNRQAGSNK